MNVQPVSFQSPGYDYSADLYALQRRQALAEALRSQSMQPMEQQSVNGIPVPISPFQALGKIAQGYTAGATERSVEQGQRSLEAKSQSDLADVLRRGSEATARGDAAGAGNIYLAHPQTATLGMNMVQQSANQAALVNALRSVGIGSPSAGPQQALNAEAAAGGQAGPTNAAAARIGQQNAGIPGVSPYTIPLMASAVPGASDIGKVVQEAYKIQTAPINVRPGGTVYIPGQGPQFTAPQNGVQTLWGPQGPAAGVVPGAQEAAARGAALTAGAQAAGRAPFELETINTPGSPTLMTRAQAIQSATGSPMSIPGLTAGGPPTRAGLTLQSQQSGAEEREFGKNLGEYASGVQTAAANAAVSNRYLDNMQLAAQDFTPGKLASAKSSLIQWGEAIGLPISEQEKKGAGSIQALTSMAIKLAGQATRQSDAQPSQLQYFKILESMPNQARTIDGFNKIVAYMRDANNYSIAKQQELQRWRMSHGGSSEGFEGAWPAISAKLPFVWNTKGPIDFNSLPVTGSRPMARQNVTKQPIDFGDLK